MKVSIGTGGYAAGCLVLGVLNAQKNPAVWITTFALGVLAGLWLGNLMASDVLKHQTTTVDVEATKNKKGLESAEAAVKAGAGPMQALNKLLWSQAPTVDELKASINGTSPEAKTDNALNVLIFHSIPGKYMTAFHLLVSGVNWIPTIDACAAFCKRIPAEFEQLGFMANVISFFALGFQVGSSIQLGRLWCTPNPGLQQKLKAVVL
ncbi:MAG TPA: hypothetical protein VFU89_04115 [Rhabdochlamydiaceae bacterium]|nr:hypothetical protein [Rhabdochlamydiaceae bacterium]